MSLYSRRQQAHGHNTARAKRPALFLLRPVLLLFPNCPRLCYNSVVTAKHSHRYQQGAWKFSTAQTLIFLMTLLCVVIVFRAYQDVNAPPPPAPAPPPQTSRTQKQLMQNIARWQAGLRAQNIALSCPYLGHDYVARIDLPDKRPITLDAWDFDSEARVAAINYFAFVNARRTARVAQPEGCIVHVFDVNGEEVARANRSGVVTSQYAPIDESL